MQQPLEPFDRRRNFQLADSMQPKDDSDRRDRSLFFATATGIICTQLLKQLIAHCEEFVSNTQGQPAPALVTKDQFGTGLKELMTISLWLSMLENGGNSTPEWFRNFLVDCLGYTDRLYPVPAAREVMNKYSFGGDIENMCQTVALTLCYQMGLGATAPDASLYFADLLAQAESERTELLKSALTESIAQLDKRIENSN